MVDKKTIGLSALASIGIIALILIVPGFFSDDMYYCEAEESLISCPGDLSGGKGTRCYLNDEKSSWDSCKSGWIKVVNDINETDYPLNYPLNEPVINNTIVEPIINDSIIKPVKNKTVVEAVPVVSVALRYKCTETNCTLLVDNKVKQK